MCGSGIVISYLQYQTEIQCQSPCIINTITPTIVCSLDIRDIRDLTSRTKINSQLKVLANLAWLFSQIGTPPTSTISAVIISSVSLWRCGQLETKQVVPEFDKHYQWLIEGEELYNIVYVELQV